MNTFDPFTEPEPVEIPLLCAPLVRVLAQVRFPPVLNLEQSGAVGRFQEAVREAYPVLRPESTQTVTIGPTGEVSIGGEATWRFHDVANAWRVSLTSQFAAIETTAYESRSNFLARFEHVLTALKQTVNPAVISRVGVRYIDRMEVTHRDEVIPLVRNELSAAWSSFDVSAAQAVITEALFLRDSRGLRARSGFLPAGATIDPATIEPAETPSWLLDLDMYRSDQREFAVSVVLEDVREFAGRIYTFFRWAVTKDFLTKYGGKP